MSLCVGAKVKVKRRAWRKHFPDLPHPGIQRITEMPAHKPFDDKVMLTYPMHWWEEGDLDPAEDL